MGENVSTKTARCIAIAAAVAASLISVAPGKAQQFPDRNITMVVPFPPGGTTDIVARILTEQLSADLGKQVIIENRGGASTSIGAQYVAGADKDGYTLLFASATTFTTNPHLLASIKYKLEDFAPVAMVVKVPFAFVVKKDFPAKTLKEFLAYAKAHPGKVTLGHAGIGSSNYLICQTFVKAAGIEATLVGYRGAGPALNDLIGGQIDGVCDTATSLSGAILGKQVNGIVSGSTVRLPSLPDVPTAAEAGLPEFESQGWNALFVPKGTSDAVIARLNEAARKALATEAVTKRFADLASVVPSAEEQTQPFIAKLVPDEIEKFRKLLDKQ